MNSLGGIVYINLDTRQDRRKEFEEESARLGFHAERFSAIRHRHGLLGCLKSHLAVLKLAQKRGWNTVLIFEDDFIATVSKEVFHQAIADLFQSGEDFDVVMLAYNLKKSSPHSDLLLRVQEAQTASAYIVHKQFYRTIIELYERNLPILQSTLLFDIYANDQVWKTLQPRAKWFAFRQRLGKQRAGFSDNTGRIEDYGC
jgi:glycosyl transferase family 25